MGQDGGPSATSTSTLTTDRPGAASEIAGQSVPSVDLSVVQSLSVAQRVQILRNTYPATITAVENNQLWLSTGASLVVDDRLLKTHQDKLNLADIKDTLDQIYPLTKCVTGKPGRNFDPGRIRNDALLRAIYGNSRSEVRSHLTSVQWFGGTLKFTTIGGADKALRAVKASLTALPRKFRKYLTRPGGTVHWRFIAGTKRLSAHSFGVAIDLNPRFADYWRWSGGKPGRVKTYRNQIPYQIIELFERHGFIWGGRWYHYDTMHFEYRPELIAIAKAVGQHGC